MAHFLPNVFTPFGPPSTGTIVYDEAVLSEVLRKLEATTHFTAPVQEVSDITDAVVETVSSLLTRIGKFNALYDDLTLIRAGSSIDGTKIMAPNEFDFVVDIRKLSSHLGDNLDRLKLEYSKENASDIGYSITLQNLSSVDDIFTYPGLNFERSLSDDIPFELCLCLMPTTESPRVQKCSTSYWDSKLKEHYADIYHRLSKRDKCYILNQYHFGHMDGASNRLLISNSERITYSFRGTLFYAVTSFCTENYECQRPSGNLRMVCGQSYLNSKTDLIHLLWSPNGITKQDDIKITLDITCCLKVILDTDLLSKNRVYFDRVSNMCKQVKKNPNLVTFVPNIGYEDFKNWQFSYSHTEAKYIQSLAKTDPHKMCIRILKWFNEGTKLESNDYGYPFTSYMAKTAVFLHMESCTNTSETSLAECFISSLEHLLSLLNNLPRFQSFFSLRSQFKTVKGQHLLASRTFVKTILQMFKSVSSDNMSQINLEIEETVKQYLNPSSHQITNISFLTENGLLL